MAVKNKRIYSWIPDLPDHRDLVYAPPAVPTTRTNIDLSPNMPAVFDQGNLGSCVSNAVSTAYQYDDILSISPYATMVPSRLFIYYNGRVIENTIKQDNGLSIRDGIKSINKYGVCDEKNWPYKITKFATKPNTKCFTESKTHTAVTYTRINQTAADLTACLASGFPFVFGISVYQSFESGDVAKTGIVPMPDPKESLLGGHGILCVGFDASKKLFKFRNSWGVTWGDKGYGYLPYDYVTNNNLADDFWTVRKVSN